MFYIPVENYPRLEKKFNRIKNKGGVVTLHKGNPVVLAVRDNGVDGGVAWPGVERGTPAWDMSPKHKFYPIEVEGKYEIPGWEFVATVEHTSGGNIIRNITDYDIPDKYKNSSPECEHCHKVRDRKDTYLVRNTETGEFKQIGKSCLKDYTDGLDAAVAAEIAEWVNLSYGDIPEMGDDIFDILTSYDSSSKYYDALRMKRVAYLYVQQEGYSKDPGYISDLIDAYNDSLKPENNKEVSKVNLDDINKWVLDLDVTSNEYFRNAFLAWNLEDLEYRHLRLITSLINTYFKDVEKKKQMELKKAEGTASEYVGNVGERIAIKVVSHRVLYYKSFYKGRHLAETPVFKIVGDDGNTYIWSTEAGFEDGDAIVATVKSHNEYNGEKQTVITRGKVVDSATSKSLEQRYRAAKNEYHDLYNKLRDSVDTKDRTTVMKPFDYVAPNDDLDEPSMSATKWYEEQIPLIKGAISDLDFDFNKLFLDEE